MKNATCYFALALLITGCVNRRLLFKQPAAVAPKETITHHFFVSGIWGQKRNFVDAAKICGGAENVVKTENPAKYSEGRIARFYY